MIGDGVARAFPAHSRVQRIAATVGVAALVAAALAGILGDATALARAYLIAYAFWVGVALGCLGIALMHRLTGGTWGRPIFGILLAAARTLPWMALAFVPLAWSLPTLYSWARPDAAHEPDLARKAMYLNTPLFIGRTAIYFLTWSTLAVLFHRWTAAAVVSPDTGDADRLRRLSSVGLVLYGFTVSFAAIDWIMTLEPRWYSTVYGGMVGISWMLSAFAFAILVAGALGGRPPLSDALSEDVSIDLGNLLLSFVVLWTYLAFVQFLIIWSGNIPEEVRWYVHRLRGGWQHVAAFLALFRFLVPLFALLFRSLKRRRRFAMILAGWMLFTSWVDTVWLVAPAFHPEAFAVHWLDPIVTIGLGGVWVALFLSVLGRGALVGPAVVSKAARQMPERAHA